MAVTAEMVVTARKAAHDAAVAESRALGDGAIPRAEKVRLGILSDTAYLKYKRLERALHRQQEQESA